MTNCRATFRRASLDPAFAQENWGFLALQDFAAKARYPPEDTPLSGSREQLLARIRQLRAELEGPVGGGVAVPSQASTWVYNERVGQVLDRRGERRQIGSC